VLNESETGATIVGNLAPPKRGQRDSAWVIALEFAMVVALFVADFKHHVFFSKTPYLFLLGWMSLRWRGLGWRDVGLARPVNWRRTIVIGVVCGIAMELLELFLTQPLLAKLFHKMPDLSDLGEMKGNWKALLLFIALSWTLAAFGEEMVYRGYLMSRVAGLFRDARIAWLVSLVVVSFLFGLGHIDQGITGQVENMINGLLLGTIFLATGCNMWAAIIAHGVTDTLDIVLLYLGKYPGL
jgi:membrane protease YdiL (CAAX protease family)